MVEKGELAERMKQIPKKMIIGLPDIIPSMNKATASLARDI